MKKNLLLLASIFSVYVAAAQESMAIRPFSSTVDMKDYESNLDEEVIAAPDLTGIAAEDLERDKNGQFYRIGLHVPVNITLANSGTWSTLANGDRVWRLKLTSYGAQGTLLYFYDFNLPTGARMHVYSPDRKQMLGAFTSYNNHESGIFATGMIQGESCIVEYYEPVDQAGKGVIKMKEFGYVYRAANIFSDDEVLNPNPAAMPADVCEVDVKCPEGTAWTNQIRGVNRIIVEVGSSTGYCSGSAINNTAMDCTPYILTAQHCADGASTADFNAWKFYFNYEKSLCGSGSSASNIMTGAALMANSNDPGITKSDFVLLETNNPFPSTFNIYLNGWDRNNTASPNGVGIHHPAGDKKKISTYTSTLVSSGWSTANTHWRVVWAATTTNHGVTEGGSSGSPIFNSSKLICGQLSGGSSFCSAPTDPDLYGKFSYSWMSCGGTSDRQLKPWLDPTNSGVMTLAGMDNTCMIGEEELAIENLFQVYPNPVQDVLIVESTGFNQTVHTMYVYDELGKLITTETINPGTPRKTVQVSNLEHGVYTVVISNGERSFSRKFVKM